ncbi:hypothetical protein [Lederbergia lenta]|uniref:hypothetical protein n=1 Tax=Lederbergia lenta TaxID=1467 RepID=UPI00203DCA2E|nr:hypothetical protein [Lederbergia lenta]MCM3113621.1 hypothetical protein [Lederbergia lenta]
MAVKSFFKIMIEEKDLLDEVIPIEHNGTQHIIEVAYLLELIESASKEDQEQIKTDFSLIDFRNGSLLHYLKYLASAYISTNF